MTVKPRFQNPYITIKDCRYGPMAYLTSDTFVGKSLDYYGEWCQKEMDTLSQLIQPGWTILDVGAYIGTHTIPFAQKVGPNGQVIAIEPQRLIHQLLCTNITINALQNVITIQAGVGAKPETLTIPLLDPSAAQNFGAFPLSGHTSGTESVSIITLDSLSLKRVHLIKIDAEGAESAILKGAAKTLAKFRPLLFIENNTESRSSGLLNALQRLKYHCWWHIYPYDNPRNFRHHTPTVFSSYQPEANLLCVPAEIPAQIPHLSPVLSKTDTWKQAYKRMNLA